MRTNEPRKHHPKRIRPEMAQRDHHATRQRSANPNPARHDDRMESNRGEQIPNKAGERGQNVQHADLGDRPTPLLRPLCVQPIAIPTDNSRRMARSGTKIHRKKAQVRDRQEMSKKCLRNGAFLSIKALTFWHGCDSIRV